MSCLISATKEEEETRSNSPTWRRRRSDTGGPPPETRMFRSYEPSSPLSSIPLPCDNIPLLSHGHCPLSGLTQN